MEIIIYDKQKQLRVSKKGNSLHKSAIRLCQVQPGLKVRVYYNGKREETLTFLSSAYYKIRIWSDGGTTENWMAMAESGGRKSQVYLGDLGIAPWYGDDGYTPYRYALKAGLF